MDLQVAVTDRGLLTIAYPDEYRQKKRRKQGVRLLLGGAVLLAVYLLTGIALPEFRL